MRNVFVIDGQLALITEYHKSQSISGPPKVVPRILPASVAQLLILYLADGEESP